MSDKTNLIVSLVAALSLMTTAGMSMAQTPLKKTIDLGDDTRLSIAEGNDRSLTVSITSGGQVTESYTVGNAAVDPAEIKRQKFCQDCVPAYFIPAYDRTSTYGATTGIVVWNPAWWRLSILPLTRPMAEDKNGDGISEIVDHEVVDGQPRETVYRFDRGFLRNVN